MFSSVMATALFVVSFVLYSFTALVAGAVIAWSKATLKLLLIAISVSPFVTSVLASSMLTLLLVSYSVRETSSTTSDVTSSELSFI